MRGLFASPAPAAPVAPPAGLSPLDLSWVAKNRFEAAYFRPAARHTAEISQAVDLAALLDQVEPDRFRFDCDGGLGAVEALGWSLDGLDVVVACDVATRFRDAAAVFGPQKGASPEQVELLEGGLTWMEHGLAYSADGTTLVTAGSGALIRVWDGRTRKLRRQFRGGPRDVSRCALSPDGRLVAAVGSSDSVIRLFRTADGTESRRLEGTEGSVTGLAFSPDERVLYVNDSNRHRKLIMAYDMESNGMVDLGSARLFCDMKGDDRPGGPDGMKVDVEGNVYCTGPGGIWVITPKASTSAQSSPAPST